MRIEVAGGGKVFVAHCTFEERFIPRVAGFKYHPTNKKWYTTDPGIVARLPIDYLSEDAKRVLGLFVTDIPKPDGKEYLPFQEEGIRFALQRRAALIGDQPGLGKGHPVTTPILTPSGWRAIGDVKPGDMVYGRSGLPVRVLKVFRRGMLPVYRVSFSDGASVMVDGDHLWSVRQHPTGVESVVETNRLERLIRTGSYSIPLLEQPVDLPPRAYPIPALSAGAYYAHAHGYRKGKVHHYLTAAEPAPVGAYALGGRGQRIDFLRGVVGAIGVWRAGNFRVDFLGSDEGLDATEAVVSIVRSLGGLASVRKMYAHGHRYRIDIDLPDFVILQILGYARENVRMGPRWRRLDKAVSPRFVTAITPSGQDEIVCITVDAPDHLYVVKDWIVTHNTVQAIGYVNALQPARSKSGLLIVPASLKNNWLKEWSRWSTRRDLSIDVVENGNKPVSKADWIIMNPEQLAKHEDFLRQRTFDVEIVDEAHYFKNKDAARTRHLFGGRFKREGRFVAIPPIPAVRKLFLSGTPITKAPADMWPIIRECDPNGLGIDFEAFAYRFCAGYHDNYGNFIADGAINLSELNQRMKETFLIRRLKTDVLKDLPEKIRQIVPLPADGLRKKMKAEKDAIENLLDAYEEMLGVQVTGSVSDIIESILKIPARVWEDYAATVDGASPMLDLPISRLATARQDLAIAKVELVSEYVSNLLEQDGPVIIFAYHQAVIEALAEKFPDFSVIYGKTPMHKRQAIVDEFQENPNRPGLIGQFTAAGVGYTMTRACHCVFAELTWVPHELGQAEDRIHRIGQEETCWEHYLVVEGSLDDSMIDRLHMRIKIIEEALD